MFLGVTVGGTRGHSSPSEAMTVSALSTADVKTKPSTGLTEMDHKHSGTQICTIGLDLLSAELGGGFQKYTGSIPEVIGPAHVP